VNPPLNGKTDREGLNPTAMKTDGEGVEPFLFASNGVKRRGRD
jgi:hypothetical protein